MSAALLAVLGMGAAPLSAGAPGPSCADVLVKGDKGISVRVLFAKNGAVQRYIVVENDTHNQEDANDAILDLQKRFGPEGSSAPPLRVVSFKQGDGGMMIPDKAIDSCGRTLSFQ